MTNPVRFLNNSLVSYFCATILLCSFVAVKVNAASLTVTDNLVLRDVDNKAVEHGFLSKKQTIDLTQGEHALVIQYKDVFEDLDMGEDRLVKSDYFVVKFVVTNQQELLLSTSKISDLASAERFAKNPELILTDEVKQELVLELETLSDYKLGLQVTKVVTTLATPAVNVQDNGTASMPDKQDFNSQVINKVDTVPMLKYWWQKANKSEKEDFLNFINKTEN